MKHGALFLLLILIAGLLLCSVLGGSCGREGFTESVQVSSGVTKNDTTDTSATNTSTSTSNGATNYDNYDHYSGTSSSTVYYGPNGGTATVTPGTNGSPYTITVTGTNGETMSYSMTDASFNSSFGSSVSSMMAQFTNKTFYGPNGGSATVVTDNTGGYAVKVMYPDGSVVIYTNQPTDPNHPTDPSNNTMNGGYITGPNGNSAGYITGPNGNTVVGTNTNTNTNYPQQQPGYYNAYKDQYYNQPYPPPTSASAGYATGPNGNTVGYVSGPYGNTMVGASTNTNPYDSALPPGIPASAIPPGQEDLYILKSEVIPPVCPVCPSSATCPRTEKCPPCPACARCPEPSFECKKVPNYNSINESYLPVPVLSNFSSFGM